MKQNYYKDLLNIIVIRFNILIFETHSYTKYYAYVIEFKLNFSD